MQQNRIRADNPRQQEEIEDLRQRLEEYAFEYRNLQSAYGDLRQKFIDLKAAHNILKEEMEMIKTDNQEEMEMIKTDNRGLKKEYDTMVNDFMRQKDKIRELKNLIKRIREDAEAKVNNNNSSTYYDDNDQGNMRYKM